MKPTVPQIDLDKPSDAKKFLRGVRIAGKEISQVTLADGSLLGIEDMTDAQLVRYAKDIYFDFCGGEEGVGAEIWLETDGQDQ